MDTRVETMNSTRTVALSEAAATAAGLYPGSRFEVIVELGRLILQPIEEDDLNALAGSLPSSTDLVAELQRERRQDKW